MRAQGFKSAGLKRAAGPVAFTAGTLGLTAAHWLLRSMVDYFCIDGVGMSASIQYSRRAALLCASMYIDMSMRACECCAA